MQYFVKQLKAAYILSTVKNYIEKLPVDIRKKINTLFDYDSYFELVSNFEIRDINNEDLKTNLCKVANNIITRGFPTIAPLIISEKFKDVVITNKDILNQLIIFDPKYVFKNSYKYCYYKNNECELKLAELNDKEIKFLSAIPSCIAQHLEYNKSIESVIFWPNTRTENYSDYTNFCLDQIPLEIITKFKNQKINYSSTLPNNKCAAIELENMHNINAPASMSNKDRDRLLKELYWQPTIKISDINDSEQYIEKLKLLFSDYLNLEDTNIVKNKNINYISMPLLAAKFALTLIFLVRNNIIALFEKESYLKINTTDKEAVILGFKNAIDTINNLIALTGRLNIKLRPLKIRVTNSEGVTEDILITNTEIKRNSAFINFNRTKYLTINENINQRIFAFAPSNNDKETIWIFSSYGQASNYEIETSALPIKYNINKDNYENLRYFLMNIFQGKLDFRPKQFDIISSALNRKNVIGLLPTGSGKSITYQLTALLQPGLTIVIAPLISLMNDQVHNLRENGLFHSNTINSGLNYSERTLINRKILNNQSQFIYVSPERFQIAYFKTIIKTKPVFNIVFDEAHCISQWGHDFRTSYLRIGNSVKTLFKNAIIMSLTGTASCNVINDIKRELDIEKNVQIVATTDFRRNELEFHIYREETDNPLNEKINKYTIENVLMETLNTLYGGDGLNKFLNTYQNNNWLDSGIIFCLFATKKGESVEAIYSKLKKEYQDYHLNIGKYHGQLSVLEKNQQQADFIANKTGLLIATKAFGMGIDKPNIRFTIHTSIPDSIEAFYQEAGRAGRDRKRAANFIVAPPQSTSFNSYKDGRISNFFISNSFPPIQNIITEAKILLNTSYVSADKFSNKILGDIFQEGLNKIDNVSLNYDVNEAGVILNIALNKDCHNKYKIYYDNNGNIEYKSLDNNNISNSNPVFNIYEEFVKNSVKTKIKNDSIDMSKLNYFFDISTKKAASSILECIDAANQDKEIYCYIGLDEKELYNPVDNIIMNLSKEKGDKIIFNRKLWNDFKKFEKNFIKFIPNNKIQEFYKFYAELRHRNNLDSISLEEFKNRFCIADYKNNESIEISASIEKILYYFSILGLYSDYERSYNPNYVKIKICKVNKTTLKSNICEYIEKFETKDFINKRLKNFDIFMNMNEETNEAIILRALSFILGYSYDKIKNFRERQSRTMFECVQSDNFNKEVYKYFEAKYYENLFNDIKTENLETPFKWIKIVCEGIEEKGENLLDNLSHLRTSCLKILEDRPQSFTAYLLYAFSIFKDESLDITLGLDALSKGIEILNKSRSRYKTNLNKFCTICFINSTLEYIEEVRWILENNSFFNNNNELKFLKNIIDEK